MARYKIPPLGPLNFPALLRDLGVTYAGKDNHQLYIWAKVPEEAAMISRFLELLTRNFRHSYSFITVIDQKTAATISGWLHSAGLNHVLDIGGGLGWLQQAFSAHGINIVAIDNYQFFFDHIEGLLSAPISSKKFLSEPEIKALPADYSSGLSKAKAMVLVREADKDSPPRQVDISITVTMAGVIRQMDWIRAARKYYSRMDALLLANPSHRSFVDALNAWGSEKPVIFISTQGIRSYCEGVDTTCNIREFGVPLPNLKAWSSIEGYQQMEVFYWHGTE